LADDSDPNKTDWQHELQIEIPAKCKVRNETYCYHTPTSCFASWAQLLGHQPNLVWRARLETTWTFLTN